MGKTLMPFGKNITRTRGADQSSVTPAVRIANGNSNSQNFLIQLDPQLRPTGRIFVRDLTDSEFVSEISESLGFRSKSVQIEIIKFLSPFNSTLRVKIPFSLCMKQGSSRRRR